jgi:hypothetical protein
MQYQGDYSVFQKLLFRPNPRGVLVAVLSKAEKE